MQSFIRDIDRPSVPSTTAGFSLLEILLVMAIAGLMISLAPPLLKHSVAGMELNTAAWRLGNALRGSRNTAIAKQRQTTLQLQLEERHYQQGSAGRIVPLPEAIDLVLTTAESEQIDAHSGAIRFFPDGSSTGARIKLRQAEREFIIDVDWLTGRVQVRS